MTPLRRIRGIVAWAAVVVIVLLAWPVRLGGHLGVVVVSGHSMDGTYHTSDLVLTWKHDTYRVGDIVVYRVPVGELGQGLRVVHRIIDGNDKTGFVTQGDNRKTPDIWLPQTSDIEGSPFTVLPRGGLALRWLFSPIALALLCACCVYLLLAKSSDDEAGDGTSDAHELTSTH